MRRFKPVPVFLFAALFLVGCAKQEEPEGVIPKGYQDALHKAGNVEADLEDAAQRQLQDLDESQQ